MEWFLENEKELFIGAMFFILVLFSLVNVFIAYTMFKDSNK